MKLRFYSQWLAQIMLYVTAGHEQAGAVEVPLVRHLQLDPQKMGLNRKKGNSPLCWSLKVSMLNRSHFLFLWDLFVERIKHDA